MHSFNRILGGIVILGLMVVNAIALPLDGAALGTDGFAVPAERRQGAALTPNCIPLPQIPNPETCDVTCLVTSALKRGLASVGVISQEVDARAERRQVLPPPPPPGTSNGGVMPPLIPNCIPLPQIPNPDTCDVTCLVSSALKRGLASVGVIGDKVVVRAEER